MAFWRGYQVYSNWNYLHERKLKIIIDNLVRSSFVSFERCVFAIIAWCMTRPGPWFSIEPPILDVRHYLLFYELDV